MGELSFSAWKGSAEASLHVLFLIHFLLIHWSHLGGWAGLSLLYQDLFLLLCLLWAVHDRRSLHPIFLAMILNVLSVILDIVVLSVWFPPKYDYPGKNTAYTTNRFAAVMAVFNLIFRAISTAVLFKVSKARDDFDGTPATSRSAVDGGRPISQISNNNGSYYMGGESPYQSSKPTIVHQPHVMRSTNNTEKHGNLPPIPPSYSVHN